ncbi:MAG TPA: YbhB/YbcL family Raf kinase inhibitor-like protein [Rhizomicrobium sp.]|jgi:Raf kinase inhibitor-like YbhB/YbcL family protein|nr:YbhB/YbcL family Raf kinase inhibitor-like protein [Rhizomicrobium sp.]
MAVRTTLTAIALALMAGPAAAMSLSSTDFSDGAAIPVAQIYPRCGGQNVSPSLTWRGVPPGSKSLVLTMIDVSVQPSGWSHWIVVDLNPATAALPHGLATLPAGARAIAGNFGDAAYDGPCPPNGSGLHRYEFTLWAMPAAKTVIAPDARAADVLATLAKTARAHATLAGTVTR